MAHKDRYIGEDAAGRNIIPMRHSVMVFPNQAPNSSLNECMKDLKTSTAVRPLNTGTEVIKMSIG
jgi:hypothetical protein